MKRFALAIVAVALISTAANASFITGAISVDAGAGSILTPVDDGGSATSLGSATGLEFDAIQGDVQSATGDFAVDSASPVTFYDFYFTGTGIPQLPTDLWSTDTFSFEMTSVNIDFQGNTALVLTGSGVVSGTGYDDTNGTWSLTANNAGSTFSFSASTETVPEPATIVVWSLLAGIASIVAVRRRKK